jgi:hypothetical protein
MRLNMRKILLTSVTVLALGNAHARPVPSFVTEPSSEILKSLPTKVQKDIEDLRGSCREYGPKLKANEPDSTYQPEITSGDGGLIMFMLSGGEAVMVNNQYICGGECLRGANCSNRNSYGITIYRRSGSTWRKVFDTEAVGDIFLSTDWVKTGEFKAMVLSVFSGNKYCPTRDVRVRDGNESYVMPGWKQSCDAVVTWDGSKFNYVPLERLLRR